MSKPREWFVIDDWSEPGQFILAVNRYDCFTEDPMLCRYNTHSRYREVSLRHPPRRKSEIA